jgi:uncharacterized membrane protein YcaP (DUF421 family)
MVAGNLGVFMIASSGQTFYNLVFSYPTLSGALAIAAKTAVIYAFLIVGLAFLGKRALGQMNIYDLVVIIVVANAVQNAMVGNDTSLVGGLVAASTLLVLNKAVTSVLAHSPRVEQVLVGEPIVLVTDGHLVEKNLRRQGITEDQIMEALREHEIDDISQARLVVLEADGTISVVPQEATVRRSRRHYRGLRLG